MSDTSSDGRGRVDLVIPVYNEAHVLESTVERLLQASKSWQGFSWRILIVDNASIDGTDEVGERLMTAHPEVVFKRLDIKGRGLALRWAWLETDSEYSLYMDVDLSTDISAIPVVVERLQAGADLVTGTRLDAASQVTRSFRRELFSRCYNWAVRLVFPRCGFSDAQCGFKGIRLATVRPLLAHVLNNHWFFDTELMLLVRYAGLDLQSVPVTWVEDLDSRVDIVQYATENLRGLLRLRFSIQSFRRAQR
jgi:glycosyltransferase involved in cell wall biosynthesis